MKILFFISVTESYIYLTYIQRFINNIINIIYQVKCLLILVAAATEYAHPIEFLSSNIIPIFSGPYLLGNNVHFITVLIYVSLHLSKAIH